MTKTIGINDETHMLIVEKQIALRKRGTDIKIQDIVEMAITAGIDIWDEE